MKNVDFHQHVYVKSDPTAERLLKYLDANAIEWALLIGSNSPNVGDNATVRDTVRAHPDRFRGAVHVDPRDGQAALDTVREYHDSGFRVVKILPFTGFYPDDPTFFPLYELIRDFGMVLMIHPYGSRVFPGLKYRGRRCGEDFSYKYGQLCYIDNLGHRYPDMKIVIAHMGASPNVAETLSMVHYHLNTYLDTSCSTALAILREIHARQNDYIKPLKLDRLLWGRDGLNDADVAGESPFLREQREILSDLCDDNAETMNLIFRKNAMEMVGLA